MSETPHQQPHKEGEPSTDTAGVTGHEVRPPCRSMHEGVETWVDTCSCEPEPRWQALAEELEAKSTQPPSRQEHTARE